MKRLKYEDPEDMADKMGMKPDPETLAALLRVADRPVQFDLPFIEFLQVIALIQLALKHPDAAKSDVGKWGVTFVRTIQEEIGQTEPLIAAVIERGFEK